MKRSPLKRKTPLRPRGAAGPAVKRVEPKKIRKARGPARSSPFLAFVRTQPCLVPGCREPSEAHHWGRRGMGQKCADWESVPLCHFHHVECWHLSRRLPGGSVQEWKERFRAESARLVEEFRSQKDR